MKLPISEYLQNWYREQGFIFTDFERAAIFWNTYLPLEDTLESLREIANTTADEGLRAQIKERLAHEAELKQGFFENNERNSVYVVSSEDKAFGIHYFSTAERAAAYGKAHSETAFTVRKERLDMEKDELACVGECTCSSVGSIENFQIKGRYYDSDEPIETHGKLERFENHLIAAKHPFRRGDIVRVEGEQELGVLETSQEENHVNWIAGGTVEVSFIDGNGSIYYDDCAVFTLEKITQWDNQPEWRFMQCMQKLLLGQGHLYDLSYFWHQYQPHRQGDENQEDL